MILALPLMGGMDWKVSAAAAQLEAAKVKEPGELPFLGHLHCPAPAFALGYIPHHSAMQESSVLLVRDLFWHGSTAEMPPLSLT